MVAQPTAPILTPTPTTDPGTAATTDAAETPAGTATATDAAEMLAATATAAVVTTATATATATASAETLAGTTTATATSAATGTAATSAATAAAAATGTGTATNSEESPADPVRLDTSSEPWVARFPGLGTVQVDRDGEVTVEVADGPEADQRGEALRWGWGEPLSWQRRGYDLTSASIVDPSDRALIIAGSHPQDIVALKALTDHGWSILADSMTPIRTAESGFEVCGRKAPVLAAKRLAESWELDGKPVRADSDTVAIDLPRHQGPALVAGVLQVRARRSSDQQRLEELSGAQRLELASGLIRRGPGSQETLSATEIMAKDLKVASLPMARLHLDDNQSQLDVCEVLAWWQTT